MVLQHGGLHTPKNFETEACIITHNPPTLDPSLDHTPSGSLELAAVATAAAHASDVLMLPPWTNSWPLASHLVGHWSRVDMTYLEIVILAPSL